MSRSAAAPASCRARRRSLTARMLVLASPEGRLLLRALLLLLEADLRLRLRGFAQTQAAFQRPLGASRRPARAEVEVDEARQLAQALRRAAPYVPRARCLHRALALLLWLRRRGVAAELCMGVRPPVVTSDGPEPERIEGHAWVEWHGAPLDEEDAVCETFGRLAPADPGHFPAPPLRP